VKKIPEFNQHNAVTWKYLASEENPADIMSRGASLSDLKKSIIRWQGTNDTPRNTAFNLCPFIFHIFRRILQLPDPARIATPRPRLADFIPPPSSREISFLPPSVPRPSTPVSEPRTPTGIRKRGLHPKPLRLLGD
jgi:hypothetical protein